MVKVDNEFKMNWAHATDVERERPFFTGASQRQCLREATRGRCVSGARVQRRQGLPKNKGREDSTSSARPVNQSKQCGIGRTRSSKCSDQNPRKVKEHGQLQAKRAYPTAGKELELLVNKHSAIEKIEEIPGVVEWSGWELLRAVQRQ